MITFTIPCSNFASAALVEKLLKANSIRYTTKLSDLSPKLKRNRASNVTATDVKIIIGYCATHRHSSDKTIGAHFGRSASVISRIRSGTHPLSTKVGEPA
jgi:hypothetical protein